MNIGDVEVTVGTEEQVDKKNNITDYPVEDGSVVSDNSERQPLILNVSGMVKGQNAFKKLQQLRKYCDNADIINYSGRNAFSNCVIESLSTSHGKNVKGGFTFTATIKQVLIAELQETNIDFDVVKPQQVNSNKNLGKKSLVEQPETTFGNGERSILPDFEELSKSINEQTQLAKSESRADYRDATYQKFADERRRNLLINKNNYVNIGFGGI